jgi:hypothetical protein
MFHFPSPDFSGYGSPQDGPPRSDTGGNSHYGGNDETYMEVGQAMDTAMIELLQSKSALPYHSFILP